MTTDCLDPELLFRIRIDIPDRYAGLREQMIKPIFLSGAACKEAQQARKMYNDGPPTKTKPQLSLALATDYAAAEVSPATIGGLTRLKRSLHGVECSIRWLW